MKSRKKEGTTYLFFGTSSVFLYRFRQHGSFTFGHKLRRMTIEETVAVIFRAHRCWASRSRATI